jgi:hypothetical protein
MVSDRNDWGNRCVSEDFYELIRRRRESLVYARSVCKAIPL